jgi:heme oxygenase
MIDGPPEPNPGSNEPIHSPSLLEAIRTATADAHAALERQLPPGGWSRAQYAAFLRATLAVVDILEPRIRKWLPDFPGRGGPGGPRLRRDLAALGAHAGGAPVGDLPDIDTIGAAYGAAYVLQGSMLGGSIIARTLQSNSQIPGDSFSYLQPPGVAVGPMWRVFTTRLDEFGSAASAAERQAAIDAAQRTFAGFAAAIAREGVS